jgi:hypothetical protein
MQTADPEHMLLVGSYMPAASTILSTAPSSAATRSCSAVATYLEPGANGGCGGDGGGCGRSGGCGMVEAVGMVDLQSAQQALP